MNYKLHGIFHNLGRNKFYVCKKTNKDRQANIDTKSHKDRWMDGWIHKCLMQHLIIKHCYCCGARV